MQLVDDGLVEAGLLLRREDVFFNLFTVQPAEAAPHGSPGAVWALASPDLTRDQSGAPRR